MGIYTTRGLKVSADDGGHWITLVPARTVACAGPPHSVGNWTGGGFRVGPRIGPEYDVTVFAPK